MNITQELDKVREFAIKQSIGKVFFSQETLEEIFGENFSRCFLVKNGALKSNIRLYFEENNELYTCLLRKMEEEEVVSYRKSVSSSPFYYLVDDDMVKNYKKDILFCKRMLSDDELTTDRKLRYQKEIEDLNVILNHPRIRLKALFLQPQND